MKRILLSFFLAVSFAEAASRPAEDVLVYTLTAFNRPVGRVVLSVEKERVLTRLGVRVGNFAQMTQHLVTFLGPDGGVEREEVRTVLNGRISSSLLVRTNGCVKVRREPAGRSETHPFSGEGSFFTFVSYLAALYAERIGSDHPSPVLLGSRVFLLRKKPVSAESFALQSEEGNLSVEAFFRRESGRTVPERILVKRFLYRGINWNFIGLEREKDGILKGP